MGRFLVAGLVTIAMLEGCTVVAGMGEPRAHANDGISTDGSTRDAGGGDAPGRQDMGPLSTDASGRLWMLNGPGNEAEATATDPNGIAFFGQSSTAPQATAWRTRRPLRPRSPTLIAEHGMWTIATAPRGRAAQAQIGGGSR
jgi:hypothetical protein